MTAGVLLLVMAMAAPAATEQAESSVGVSPSLDGELSTLAPQPPTPALGSARLRTPRHQGRPNAEDRRLQRLVKGLKLDAAQEAEVRRALQAHREAIRKLMSAPADPEVPRVAVIHAISNRTAMRIRAVLNDEQKKLYGEPLPHDPAMGEGKPSVEEWLKALRQKGN